MILFSIIIPVYNGEDTIIKTIKSCLKQTETNFEVIVVDNASSDRTQEFVKSIQDIRIKYFFLEQKGRSNARNYGIHVSQGKYIQFLDADDQIDEKKLYKAKKIFSQDEGIEAVQCGTIYFKNKTIIKKVLPYKGKDFRDQMYINNLIPINSIIIKREICKEFPIDYEYCEDWIFWIETLKNRNIQRDYNYYGSKVFIHHKNTMSDRVNMHKYHLIVLLKYYNEKLIFSKRILRFTTTIKLYVEYILSGNTSIMIDNLTSQFKFLNLLRRINEISVINSFFKKIYKFFEKENLYS